MEVDQINSPASSSSSYDFLPELVGPLKRMVFECFASNYQPIKFIEKFNQLLEQELLPNKPNSETTIQSLLEIGCAKNECNSLLFPYLDALCECGYFDHKQYIVALTAYRDFNKPQCLLSFVQKVGQLLKRVNCDFRDDKAVYELCNTFVVALSWYFDLLRDIFVSRRENAIQQLVKVLITHIDYFNEDHFARYVAFCCASIDADIFQRLYNQSQNVCEQLQEMSKGVYIPKDIKELVEQLSLTVKNLPSKPDFPVEYVKTYRFGTTQPRPAILSLVTVYSVFRVMSKNEEIANALINIGSTLLMSKGQILTDLFRGIFLILLDYHESDENTAEQHQSLHTLILAEVFVYKRMGQIVELLLGNGQCSVEELMEALTKLASNSVLMNALDRRQLDNTLANILDNSKIPTFLSNDQYAKIMDLRMESMKKDADLFYLLYANQNVDVAQRERSRHYQFTKADELAQKIRENPNEQLMIELIDRADLIHVDMVLACLLADGKIKTFSAKLATYVSKLEHSSQNEDITLRNEIFDSAFLLLMRIRQLFLDLRLEEMTDGDANSIFYKWTEKVYEHLEKNHPMPVNAEIKQSTFMTHFSRLKIGHAFWNGSWDYAQLLDHAPAIGEALLDEISTDGHKIDEDALKNILTTFGELSCMFLCLTQWLETNQNSENLQMLSAAFREVGLRFVKQFDRNDITNKPHMQHQVNRWTLMMQLVTPNLARLARGPRTPDIIYPYLVNCARRQVRPLDPHEIPDMQVLKDAFFYATQQGWTSPNVIVCIDRLTKNVKQVEWIQCWFQQMLKLANADELEIASELFVGASMTKPVICLLGMVRKIIDENEFASTLISFNHTWILARVLVRAMLIVCWTHDTWKNNRKRFKKWQLSRKRKAVDDEHGNEDKDSHHSPMEEVDEDDTVIQTLKTVFLVLQKETKPSVIRLRITFICFFMLELAMAPPSEYRQRLIDMIPDGMIFTLCRLEPTCFNLPILLKIYDTNNAEHRQLCLQLACMLRKVRLT